MPLLNVKWCSNNCKMKFISLKFIYNKNDSFHNRFLSFYINWLLPIDSRWHFENTFLTVVCPDEISKIPFWLLLSLILKHQPIEIISVLLNMQNSLAHTTKRIHKKTKKLVIDCSEKRADKLEIFNWFKSEVRARVFIECYNYLIFYYLMFSSEIVFYLFFVCYKQICNWVYLLTEISTVFSRSTHILFANKAKQTSPTQKWAEQMVPYAHHRRPKRWKWNLEKLPTEGRCQHIGGLMSWRCKFFN